MNKFTKLLSVFIIAGAIGAGVAGAATLTGCKKTPTTPPGEQQGDQLEVNKDVTGLIVEGVGDTEVQLSTTKTSHDITKSAIKVYFAKGTEKAGEVPADNVTVKLYAPDASEATSWEGLKINGDYVVEAQLKNCKWAEGGQGNVNGIKASVAVKVKNAAVSVAVKTGGSAVFSQNQKPADEMTSTWTYEITRANGDKEDIAADKVTVTGVDCMVAGADQTANLSCTVEEVAVTGTVKFSVTADDTKVVQSYALNFGALSDASAKNIKDGKVVKLPDDGKTEIGEEDTTTKVRFEVLSQASGSVDSHNKDMGTKYFTNRLKTNGSSTAVDKNTKKGTPRYIKVHADGAARLLVYAYNNGDTFNDGKSRSVSVYAAAGVTFADKEDTEKAGALILDDKKKVGDTAQVPSKDGKILNFTLPEAGDYYIVNGAAMTYCYVQLDQLLDKEGNAARPLQGTQKYVKLSASHTSDTEEADFKKVYKVGDTFAIDTGYTFKAASIDDVTCEKKADETLTTTTAGLTYLLGKTDITTGYTFTNDNLGEQTVTVSYSGVTTTIKIMVETEIDGVYGFKTEFDKKAVQLEEGVTTLTIAKSEIKTSILGSSTNATISEVVVKYRLKTAAEGSETELTNTVDLGLGEYVFIVTVKISDDSKNVSLQSSFDVSITEKTNTLNWFTPAEVPGTTTVAAGSSIVDNSMFKATADGKMTYVTGAPGEFKLQNNSNKTVTVGLQTGKASATDTTTVTIKAKTKVTLTAYVMFTNQSFNSNRVGSIKYTVAGGTEQTATGTLNSDNKIDRTKMIAITVTLNADESLVMKGSTTADGCLYLYGIEATLIEE